MEPKHWATAQARQDSRRDLAKEMCRQGTGGVRRCVWAGPGSVWLLPQFMCCVSVLCVRRGVSVCMFGAPVPGRCPRRAARPARRARAYVIRRVKSCVISVTCVYRIEFFRACRYRYRRVEPPRNATRTEISRRDREARVFSSPFATALRLLRLPHVGACARAQTQGVTATVSGSGPGTATTS